MQQLRPCRLMRTYRGRARGSGQPRGYLRDVVWLRVSDIAAGSRAMVLQDCYKGMLEPKELFHGRNHAEQTHHLVAQPEVG